MENGLLTDNICRHENHDLIKESRVDATDAIFNSTFNAKNRYTGAKMYTVYIIILWHCFTTYQGRHVYRESWCGYFVMISSTRVDMYTEKVGVGIL